MTSHIDVTIHHDVTVWRHYISWHHSMTSLHFMTSQYDVTIHHDVTVWHHYSSWRPILTPLLIMTSQYNVTTHHDVTLWRHYSSWRHNMTSLRFSVIRIPLDVTIFLLPVLIVVRFQRFTSHLERGFHDALDVEPRHRMFLLFLLDSFLFNFTQLDPWNVNISYVVSST